MKKGDVTVRGNKVREKIIEFMVMKMEGEGSWPTYREIAEHVDLNLNAISGHFKVLLAQGKLTWVKDGRARRICPSGYKVTLVKEIVP